jgi:hypothetical protein
MLSLFRNLFGRPSRFRRFGFGRDPVVTPRRGGVALGSLAALAVPFIIRKLMARRAERPITGPAY